KKETLGQLLHQHHIWHTQQRHIQGSGLSTMHCTASDLARCHGKMRATHRQLLPS
ncbi:hypothetical protein NDU88_003964, partial [Pleurodeles waltl]